MDTNFNDEDVEILRKRALLFRALGEIQMSEGLKSLSVLQYYATHLGLDNTMLNTKVVKKLVGYAKEGEEHIEKTVKIICDRFSIDKEGMLGFTSIVFSEGAICDYFLDHKSEDIIIKIASYSDDDKIYAFIKDIYPEFDFDKFFRDYTY